MEEVKQIIKILLSMPSWADDRASELDFRLRITADMRQIAMHNIESIKEAMMDYINSTSASPEGYSTVEMSKLFVLNRFLFNIPQFEEPDRPGFGGFLGVPVEGGMVNKLWPLTKEGDELMLSFDFKGYSGESYLAIKEFEDFQIRYGVRTH